jgi:RsiW-degrading membrane proteinase PrsW (M82 family)/DNA-directed RNA polymerase subunit RPC12/RpoP
VPQIIACSACAKKFSAPDQLAGREVACPACKAAILIPSLGASARAVGSPKAQVVASSPKATRVPKQLCIIKCPNCSKQFKAATQLQGKRLNCPSCKNDFVVKATLAIAPSSQTTKQLAPAGLPRAAPPGISPVRKPLQAAKLPDVAQPKQESSRRGDRPRFLFFAFVLTLLPLILQTLNASNDIEQRFARTLSAHPEIADKIENLSEDDLFELLPGDRIEGAHLSRSSRTHWVYAAIAASAFCGMVWLLFECGATPVWHWLIVLSATATVGIISLIAFQWIAEATQGVWLTGRSILVALFYIVKFIGFSYRAAMDESYGFLASFFGFTCGVGFCEELTKALPVIVLLHAKENVGWRSACVLGLASGVGFGVMEGIMYSGHFYNGLMSYDIYLTRFISCVALHATWTAAAAVMAEQSMAGFETTETLDWCKQLLYILAVPMILLDWCKQLLYILAVPMILHGLYDTLLKREMGGYALLVAVISFAWLAFMLERARTVEEHAAPPRVAGAAAWS